MREKKLSIRLGDKLHAELSKKASKYNQSISEYVRNILIKDIEEEEKMKLSVPSVKTVENGITYLERTPEQVEGDLEKLSRLRNDEGFLDYWRKLLSVKEPVCPKCGEVGGPLRQTAKGEVVGCDKCLKVKGYIEEEKEQKEIWVLMNPDNEHWNEEFAQDEIDRLCKKWNVKAVATTKTRDSGHGQERLFIVSGEPEAVLEFEKELDEVLY